MESNSAFSLSRLTTTNQTLAMLATHQVETSGVRYRGAMCANRRGSACRRAIDRPVRDAGRIVVWVEAIADGGHREQHHPVPAADDLGGEQAEDRLLLVGVLGQVLRAGEGEDGVRHAT